MSLAVDPSKGTLTYSKSYLRKTDGVINAKNQDDPWLIGVYDTYKATYGTPTASTALTVFGSEEVHRLTNFKFLPIGTSVIWSNYGYNGIGSLSFYRANGSEGAETSIGNGNILNQMRVFGYHENRGGAGGGTYYQAAEQRFTANAAIGLDAEMPCMYQLYLTPDGGVTSIQVLRVEHDGKTRIGSTNSAAVERVHVEGNVRLGTGTGDSYLYFDSTTDALITWDVSELVFDFTRGIKVNGDIEHTARMIRSKSYYVGADTTDDVYLHVCDSASAFTLTVTDGTDDGEEIKITNRGVGTVTLSGNISSVTATSSLITGETIVLNWDEIAGEWQ